MNNSIQEFLKSGIVKISNCFENYAQDPKKFAEMIYGIRNITTEFVLGLISEEFELYDKIIRDNPKRKELYYVVRTDEHSFLTCLGPIRYKKTLYKRKSDGKHIYLLDAIFGFSSHERISEDALAAMFSEAAESSYEKAGNNICPTADKVSRQTVMNKLRELQFPPNTPKEVRSEKYLYIDADEDHVSLQNKDAEGSIVEPKMVYLYEGLDGENRNRLINPVYFGGDYHGSQGVRNLWEAVDDYIREGYDEDTLKTIYISGDGAGWIKSAESHIPKSKFVLDKFHMHKYIIKATSHLEDMGKDARADIYRCLETKDKSALEDVFDAIIAASAEQKHRAVNTSKTYILGNWKGIMRQRKSLARCSAEGHVSHIYSDRLSSRPLSWSRKGADKMARLRIYRANGGNMLELVRYQNVRKVAGLEDMDIHITAADIFAEEKRQRQSLGAFYGTKTYSIPPQIRKILAITERIYGL